MKTFLTIALLTFSIASFAQDPHADERGQSCGWLDWDATDEFSVQCRERAVFEMEARKESAASLRAEQDKFFAKVRAAVPECRDVDFRSGDWQEINRADQCRRKYVRSLEE